MRDVMRPRHVLAQRKWIMSALLVSAFVLLALTISVRAENELHEEVSPTPPAKGTSTFSFNPQWSPDGSHIAFVSSRDGNLEIYTMNADGSAQTRLTHEIGGNFRPTWSPDGKRIGFTANRESKEIFMMNADGSNIIRYTNDYEEDFGPDWSPDGTQLLYETVGRTFTGYRIQIMSSEGVFLTNLRSSDETSHDAVWSPDGKRIVFVSYSPQPDIYSVNVDGSDLRNLTQNEDLEEFPTFSPNGQYIAFTNWDSGSGTVSIMNSDGSDPRQLFDGEISTVPHAWSPDSRFIALVSDSDSEKQGIVVINVQNLDANFIREDSDILGRTNLLDWSPDGKHIAFDVKLNNNYEIYTMNPDGTNVKQLTPSQAVLP